MLFLHISVTLANRSLQQLALSLLSLAIILFLHSSHTCYCSPEILPKILTLMHDITVSNLSQFRPN